MTVLLWLANFFNFIVPAIGIFLALLSYCLSEGSHTPTDFYLLACLWKADIFLIKILICRCCKRCIQQKGKEAKECSGCVSCVGCTSVWSDIPLVVASFVVYRYMSDQVCKGPTPDLVLLELTNIIHLASSVYYLLVSYFIYNHRLCIFIHAIMAIISLIQIVLSILLCIISIIKNAV